MIHQKNSLQPIGGTSEMKKVNRHRVAPGVRLRKAGDMDGKAVWLRILAAVDELLSGERPEGTEVH